MVRGSRNLLIFDLSEYVRRHFAECSGIRGNSDCHVNRSSRKRNLAAENKTSVST
jgi:hypothetical protein